LTWSALLSEHPARSQLWNAGSAQRAELTDRTLIWSVPHLVRLLRECEKHYNSQRPHRSLGQAAPTRPPPNNVIDLDEFRVRRNDRAGGVIHEYTQAA